MLPGPDEAVLSGASFTGCCTLQDWQVQAQQAALQSLGLTPAAASSGLGGDGYNRTPSVSRGTFAAFSGRPVQEQGSLYSWSTAPALIPPSGSASHIWQQQRREDSSLGPWAVSGRLPSGASAVPVPEAEFETSASDIPLALARPLPAADSVDLLHLSLFVLATIKTTLSRAVPGGPGSLQDSRLAVGSGGLPLVGASGKFPEYAPSVDNSIGSQLAASVLSSEDRRHGLAGFSSASSLSIAQPGTSDSRS